MSEPENPSTPKTSSVPLKKETVRITLRARPGAGVTQPREATSPVSPPTPTAKSSDDGFDHAADRASCHGTDSAPLGSAAAARTKVLDRARFSAALACGTSRATLGGQRPPCAATHGSAATWCWCACHGERVLRLLQPPRLRQVR